MVSNFLKFGEYIEQIFYNTKSFILTILIQNWKNRVLFYSYKTSISWDHETSSFQDRDFVLLNYTTEERTKPERLSSVQSIYYVEDYDGQSMDYMIKFNLFSLNCLRNSEGNKLVNKFNKSGSNDTA